MIKEGRSVKLCKEDGTGEADEIGPAKLSQSKLSQSEGVYTITIKNAFVAALPITGGPGTRLFTILGSTLILGAGVLLWRRRRLM